MLYQIFSFTLTLLVLYASAGQITQSNEHYRYVHRTWPKLVGVSAEAAKVTMLKDMPGLLIEVRQAKDGITSTLKPNQVNLYVDADGRVVTMPETFEKVPYTEVFMRWPEAVGMEVERAKELIRKEKPEVTFDVIKEGSPVTLDLRPNRVRLFVNDKKVVVDAPENG